MENIKCVNICQLISSLLLIVVATTTTTNKQIPTTSTAIELSQVFSQSQFQAIHFNYVL